MTEEKIQTLKDDIAFMKALAQEGSSVPLLFGGNMVAAGLIFGAGSVGHWLIATGILQVSDWAYLINWLGAGALFGVVCTLLIRRASRRPGYSAGVNKATGSAWSGVGFAIFAMWLGMTAYGYRTGQWEVMNIFPTVIFALYGAAWMVAGDMTGKAWIKLVALGSFAGAVLMGFMSGTTQQMLGYAGCLFLLAVVPGLVLMRQEPTDLV
jgi:energy-converting hydrogenase Eha subunit A